MGVLRERCGECGEMSVERIVGKNRVILNCLNCGFSSVVADQVKSKEVEVQE